jgi:hypothetical protein
MSGLKRFQEDTEEEPEGTERRRTEDSYDYSGARL